MNADIKARWTAALRSGEYPQTKGALRRLEPDGGARVVGFCCLGVLCDLAEKDGIIKSSGITGNGVLGYPSERDLTETSVLPLLVQQWADLPGANPDINVDASLASVNDDGLTFAQIADLIDRRL